MSTNQQMSRNSAGGASSPHDLFFQQLEQVLEKNNCIGQMLVRGISGDEEEDTNKYTTEQMQSLRFIAISEERATALEDMDKLILGDQYGDSFFMFNTSFSYHVLDCWEIVKNSLAKSKSWPNKFNLLLGFTNAIKEFDTWMHDHEVGWGGEVFLADLAKRWKALLKKSNQELGIDEEFTRPGIVCFLERFKTIVEAIDTYDEPEIHFNFQ